MPGLEAPETLPQTLPVQHAGLSESMGKGVEKFLPLSPDSDSSMGSPGLGSPQTLRVPHRGISVLGASRNSSPWDYRESTVPAPETGVEPSISELSEVRTSLWDPLQGSRDLFVSTEVCKLKVHTVSRRHPIAVSISIQWKNRGPPLLPEKGQSYYKKSTKLNSSTKCLPRIDTHSIRQGDLREHQRNDVSSSNRGV